MECRYAIHVSAGCHRLAEKRIAGTCQTIRTDMLLGFWIRNCSGLRLKVSGLGLFLPMSPGLSIGYRLQLAIPIRAMAFIFMRQSETVIQFIFDIHTPSADILKLNITMQNRHIGSYCQAGLKHCSKIYKK